MDSRCCTFPKTIAPFFLAAIVFLNGCSGGGPASIRYKFSTPEFSSEDLEALQLMVQSRIKTLYEKRDGKSAGCDWVLRKKGEPDEPANRIYFSDARGADSYVIGISGKKAFRDFASHIEAETEKLFPGKNFESDKTSKAEKSIQFLKSEMGAP